MQNGAVISDMRQVTTSNFKNGTWSKGMGIRQKVIDYISYSVVKEDNVAASDVGTCAAKCGKLLFKQKCCATITASTGQT